ncbi:MAG: hypothetical protein P5693_26515, partial [Limnospira sp. PMC 1290.21]|uniref:hypothetical protein n=1 Tax=Limnospira sp. PMC 1290.21 TaxID=2981073 RepID=UPI0028E0D340
TTHLRAEQRAVVHDGVFRDNVAHTIEADSTLHANLAYEPTWSGNALELSDSFNQSELPPIENFTAWKVQNFGIFHGINSPEIHGVLFADTRAAFHT